MFSDQSNDASGDSQSFDLGPWEDALRALFETVIPQDQWPGGWLGGVERLLREHSGDFMSGASRYLILACEQLDDASRAGNGCSFAELSPIDRAQLFASLALDESGNPLEPFATVIDVAMQGFYAGTREPAGWAMVGFQPEPSVPLSDGTPQHGTGLSEISSEYDVVVVGAGAGGGVAAAELTAAGKTVLLVDRSRPMTDRELRGNHLQGKRLQTYDVTAGPGDGSPRVWENEDGTSDLLLGDGDGGAYGLTAMTLGGGTRLWQGMAWRFLPEDFAMASVYGSPEGSTLADWPFGYDELAPYYDRVESELGVSGSIDHVDALRAPRRAPYPMPPMPDDETRRALSVAADNLGWSSSPIPFAINSVPRDGRGACVRCAQCVGHACPVNAKNGTHNTFIPGAVSTGRCDLLLSAQAVEIEHNGKGRALGVRLVVVTSAGPVEKFVRARQVVVAAGAVETPRLLLASGLGNAWVGRNHHSHGGVLAYAGHSPRIKTYTGPGHSVATLQWVHKDGLAWGGGVMFDAPPMYPATKAAAAAEFGIPVWGAAHKEWMRSSGVQLGTMSMVQEIPHELSSVTLDPLVKDRWGMPAARMRGRSHVATREAVDFIALRCNEWLEEAGGRQISTHKWPGGTRGDEHSAGTARLALSPDDGACDPDGLLFGTENVFVADASLHPSNGGFNPGLTVMANALRVAALMLR